MEKAILAQVRKRWLIAAATSGVFVIGGALWSLAIIATPVLGQAAASPAAIGSEGGGGVSTSGAVDSGPRMPLPANPVATNAGGGVTVKVTWQGKQAADGAIAFLVILDTHSVALDEYDLSTMAVLRNDQGIEVAPLSWEAPPGGHHREGLLTFPVTYGTGKPTIGPEVQGVELVIRGVAKVPERVLSWEVS